MSGPEWQKIGQSRHQPQQQLEQQQQQLEQQQKQLEQQRLEQLHHETKVGDRLWGRVERVVPGRLVYVEFAPGHEARVFKLNNLLIKQANGTFSNYAGEPLSQLGLTVGSSVEVVTARQPHQANVVFDPLAQSGMVGKAKDFFRTG